MSEKFDFFKTLYDEAYSKRLFFKNQFGMYLRSMPLFIAAQFYFLDDLNVPFSFVGDRLVLKNVIFFLSCLSVLFLLGFSIKQYLYPKKYMARQSPKELYKYWNDLNVDGDNEAAVAVKAKLGLGQQFVDMAQSLDDANNCQSVALFKMSWCFVFILFLYGLMLIL